MTTPTSLTAPRRIVSLLSSATEILFALGLGERVVGISHECDWPAEATSRPRVTRSLIDAAATSDAIDAQVKLHMQTGLPLYEVDATLLESLRPDLIITQAQCDVCAVKYEDVLQIVRDSAVLKHAKVLPLQPNTLSEILNDVIQIGQSTNATTAAANFVSELQTRVQRIAQATSALPVEQRPKVACIEWIEPLMLAANWTPELIELAGGQCSLTRAGQHSVYQAWPEVVAFDPELIIVSPCGFDLERSLHAARVLPSWPNWPSLAAVKAERVFVVDGNAYLNRSGPRIVDSLEILAHLLHPHLFAAPEWSETRSPAFCQLFH